LRFVPHVKGGCHPVGHGGEDTFQVQGADAAALAATGETIHDLLHEAAEVLGIPDPESAAPAGE
jgi:hypothetical protein